MQDISSGPQQGKNRWPQHWQVPLGGSWGLPQITVYMLRTESKVVEFFIKDPAINGTSVVREVW